MSKKVAFLGLGVMGFPMAGHLAAKGFDVTVYNRTAEKADAWLKEYKGKKAATPMAAAQEADIVFACVGADKDVREITLGLEGAFSGMNEGAVFIDHTTVSAQFARELDAEAKARGLGFLDAPVSGGEAGAVNGQLTIMVGGDEKSYKKCESAMQSYAKMVRLLGPAGSGQTAKMVNQICIAGVVQGLSEAIHFGLEAGLDMPAVIDVISKGAAGSWQMDNRATTMIKGEFDFGFAVNWMRKDLDIVLGEAERLGLDLPLTKLVDGFYAEVQKMGGGRQDTSSLIRRFRG